MKAKAIIRTIRIKIKRKIRKKIEFFKNPKNLVFFIFLSLGAVFLYKNKEINEFLYNQSFVVGAVFGFIILSVYLLLGLYIMGEFIYNRHSAYKRFIFLYGNTQFTLNPFQHIIFLIVNLRKIVRFLKKIFKK